MTRETFTNDQVSAMNLALQAAPKAKGKLSKGEVLREMAPTLKMLREDRGYTLEALVDLLATQGLKVKISTIQGALKKKGGTKKKAPAAPTAAQLTPLSAKAPDVDVIGVISRAGKKAAG